MSARQTEPVPGAAVIGNSIVRFTTNDTVVVNESFGYSNLSNISGERDDELGPAGSQKIDLVEI
jgi:hypothetical protein